MTRNRIESILVHFSPISLMEMDQVCLMNRIDTKFTAPLYLLPDVLKCLQNDYLAQEINGSCLNAYRTLYLDTVDRAMYFEHHNERRKREKIRVRSYSDSQTVFLEVKNKNNKGRTKKKRFQLPEMYAYHEKEAKKFLEKHAKYPLEALLPQLESRFDRITLVNKMKTERLTIDIDLKFSDPSTGLEKPMNNLVIIELKQQAHQPSFAKSILTGLKIRPMAISKYCLGTILTVPEIKSNLFKEKIIRINKISEKQYGFV